VSTGVGISGAETGRAPQTWQRLWLYDRRSGYLFGYRTGKDTDENSVDLAAFFASLVSPNSIGRGDCAFTDMVERGLRGNRYACMGAICAEQGEPGSATIHSTHRDVIGFATSRDVSKLPSGAAATCGESPGTCGGGDGCGGGGGVGMPGRNWAAQAVACVSEQVVTPYEESFRCFSEATGRCSDPVGKATKRLTEALYSGIRFGNRCGLVQTGGGGGFDTDKFLENVNKMLDELVEDPEKWAREQARKELEKAQQNTNDRTDEALDALKELEEKEKSGSEAEKKAKEKNDKAQGTTTEAARCPPDTPDCGGDSCTGMGAAIGGRWRACSPRSAAKIGLRSIHSPVFLIPRHSTIQAPARGASA
jgi:hypothetical protein